MCGHGELGDRQHGCCGDGGNEPPLVFDDNGELVTGSDTLGQLPTPLLTGPCSLATVNGSWLVTLTPLRGITAFGSEIRGPMRIQVTGSALRVSGDIYVRRTGLIAPLAPVQSNDLPPDLPIDAGAEGADGQLATLPVNGAPGTPTYPQFPKNQYSWYFRSAGVTYGNGALTFQLIRHLWDRTSQEFISQDTGQMQLNCRRSLLTPFGIASMTGTATIGGTKYSVAATKTSNLYRGCQVEVDVMTGRVFPASATIGSGAVTSFRQIYASGGWDVTVRLDEVNVPEDASLTNAELQTLLAGHRGPAPAGDPWRLWLLVGSSQGTLFGVMFDEDSVPREGAVGFADGTLGNGSTIDPSARNRPLDEVPSAFLRTLVHEAGHALNLFHPKHDVHAPPIGTEIMNQTGDVIGFATVANPYPRNASFAFAQHDLDSLVHSPDPQVRPGWKPFGWGHGSLSSGLPVPVDANGLVNADDDEMLRLELSLPAQVFVGEYVVAETVLTNTGDIPRQVSTRLNLAEGDLRLLHVLPGGAVEQTRDVVVACGPRAMTTLAPGEQLRGRMQVLFTSEGVTFSEPGMHIVRAEFDVDGFTSVRSDRVTVTVRSAASSTERDIALATLDPGVGLAIALGDFGANEDARQRITTVAEDHPDADTGAACALVLANSFARGHVDFRTAEIRLASTDDAQRYLALAAKGRSAEQLLTLAATVASPVERDAPVVADALAQVKRSRRGKADVALAEVIAEDFVESSAR